MRKKHAHVKFILPGFVLYTCFIIIPIIYVFYLSFFKWSGLGPKEFVAFENFKTIFTDAKFSPIFFKAFLNNIKYLACVWLIITPIQYLIAYLFFIKIPAHKYLRFMIFMPYVISSTIVGFFATMIFNPNIGFLNKFLEAVGLGNYQGAWFGDPKWAFKLMIFLIVGFFATMIFNPNIGFLNKFLEAVGLGNYQGAWFGDPKWAFKLMIFLIIWQSSASGTMIFYSNFLDISKDVMEACRIDGCSEWQRFLYILVPLSLPSCASIITMSTIWALALFDMPFLLGGQNGGISGSLDFANLVFYRYTFGSTMNGKSEMGFGASICVVMFIAMMLVTLFQNKILKKFEYEN